MKNSETQWHRQARAQGLHYIVLVYEKAEGFVFCPTDSQRPFRVGGDYEGCFPTNAAGAKHHVDNWLNPVYRNRVLWFVPFLQAILQGEDFSLADLGLETRRVRLIHGRWPW